MSSKASLTIDARCYSITASAIQQQALTLPARLNQLSQGYDALLRNAVRAPNFVGRMELMHRHIRHIESTPEVHQLLERTGLLEGNEVGVAADEVLEAPTDRVVIIGINVYRVWLDALRLLDDLNQLSDRAKQDLNDQQRIRYQAHIRSIRHTLGEVSDQAIALQNKPREAYEQHLAREQANQRRERRLARMRNLVNYISSFSLLQRLKNCI